MFDWRYAIGMQGMQKVVLHKQLWSIPSVLSRIVSWYVFPSVGAICVPGRINLEKEVAGIRWYVIVESGRVNYPQKAQIYSACTMSRILAGWSLHQHVLFSATPYSWSDLPVSVLWETIGPTFSQRCERTWRRNNASVAESVDQTSSSWSLY